MTSYAEFLAAKASIAQSSGLPCEPEEVNPLLKPHQRDAVVWAVRGGRRGVGIELSATYFRDARFYVEAAAAEAAAPTLFDLLGLVS